MATIQTDRIASVNASSAIKVPCRVATTADLTPSLSGGALGSGGGGLPTIDGVALAANDRVLVKNQTDQTTNGIYLATATAWQRAVDFADNLAAVKGTIVLVTDGTTAAGLWFELTTANPVTFGASAITFAVTSNPTVSSAMAAVVGASTLPLGRAALGLNAAAVESLGGAIVDDGGGNLTIKANSATNAMLAPMAAATIKGNSSGASANPSDLSVASVIAMLMSAGLLRSYLAGMTLSNDAVAPNTVLDIAAGSCVDGTNAAIINLGAITKSTAGLFAVGSGNNGMGVGLTIAASTWYHVFAIVVSGAADIYFDTSVTAANKPAGTTAFRRIGSFKTDASAHILAFVQMGDYFWWVSNNTDDVSGAALGATATSFTVNVPPGVNVLANWVCSVFVTSGNSSGNIRIYDPTLTDFTVASTTGGPLLGIVDNAAINVIVRAQGTGWTRTNTSAQLRAIADLPCQFSLRAIGWLDYRGRFA